MNWFKSPTRSLPSRDHPIARKSGGVAIPITIIGVTIRRRGVVVRATSQANSAPNMLEIAVTDSARSAELRNVRYAAESVYAVRNGVRLQSPGVPGDEVLNAPTPSMTTGYTSKKVRTSPSTTNVTAAARLPRIHDRGFDTLNGLKPERILLKAIASTGR